MAKPSPTVSPRRAWSLWVLGLCVVAGWMVRTLSSDDTVSRVGALLLAAGTAIVAVSWLRRDRRVRGGHAGGAR